MTNAQRHTIDRQRAIETNRAALLRVVAALFVYAGLDEGGADTVPRRVWRRIVRLLRPAEAAARRLIVIAASGIEVAPPKPRPEKPPSAWEDLQARGLLIVHEGMNLGLARMWRPEPDTPEKPAPRIPSFPLADPPRRFDAKGWEGRNPFPENGFALADPHEEVDARHLCRRIRALKRALDDIDGHAKRLARREARRELALKSMQGGFGPAVRSGPVTGRKANDLAFRATNARSDSEGPPTTLTGANHIRIRKPLRLGRPPGYRKRPVHEVDDVLRECHALVAHDRPPPQI